MSLIVSEQIEARIMEEARKQGVSVDTLLERLINEYARPVPVRQSQEPELPVWHLGAASSFHRRDIYDDVH